MSKGIYTGLTNAEAFNLMSAMIQCRKELPALEGWSLRRHWIWGCCVAVALFLSVDLYGSTLEACIATAAVAVGTWWSARRTVRKREFMKALAIGLHEFKETATGMGGGASSAQILAAMPAYGTTDAADHR